MRTLGRFIFLAGLALALAGCRRDMFNQPKSNPMRESDFFPDRSASRPLPANTVARDDSENDAAFYTGMIGTNPVTLFPMPVTAALLERGRQRFEIACAPCHGETGEGDGMVVQRGFPAPPSYHISRLRTAPVGHLFDVMTRGYGAMFSQAERVVPEDRWAIAAYIRALQLSENATLADVPSDEAEKLRATP